MTRLHVPVHTRWSDLDAYQHVNNVEVFRLLEEARITAFWQHTAPGEAAWPTAILETGPHASSHTFVAGQQIEYLRPLGFTRQPVRVELWLGALGGASLQICYELHDGAPGGFPRLGPASGADPYVRASTTIVLVDAATGRPRRLTDDERAVLTEYLEEPVTFRR